MGSNKRDLKAYVRYDGSGRVVAGSLILRRSKPKVGKWTEIQGYQCCNGEVNINYEPVDTSLNGIAFSLSCTSGSENSIYAFVDATSTNITDLVAILNTNLPYIGVFKVNADGVTIDLTVNAEINNTFTAVGCTGGLEFSVVQD